MKDERSVANTLHKETGSDPQKEKRVCQKVILPQEPELKQTEFGSDYFDTVKKRLLKFPEPRTTNIDLISNSFAFT